jgi:hypothetical protein
MNKTAPKAASHCQRRAIRKRLGIWLRCSLNPRAPRSSSTDVYRLVLWPKRKARNGSAGDIHTASEECHAELMSRRAVILLPIMAMAAGCASAVGPSQNDLATLLQASLSDIRGMRCYDIEEEPTEFGCRFDRRGATGAWVQQEIMLAIDGSDWVVIDGPGPPYRD